MNKPISDLLNSLLQTVAYYDEQMGINPDYDVIESNPVLLERMGFIRDLYEALSKEDRDEFFQVLDREFVDDALLLVFLFSFMIKAIHSPDILTRLVDIICRGQLDVYTNVALEFQLSIEINKHYGATELYDIQRKLHTFNSECLKREIQPPSEYIPYHSRMKGRVVIIAEQLLSEQHAPSKIIYDMCYTLQKYLNMEVLLISCPISAAKLKANCGWMERIYTDIYYTELNGNAIVCFEDGKMYSGKYDLNDYFVIQYRGVGIKGRQISFDFVNTDGIKKLIDIIYEFNPEFVYNVDAISPIAELCSGFTTVVSGAMRYGYPISDAHILMRLIKNDEQEDDGKEFTVLNPYHQLVIKNKLQFNLDMQTNSVGRARYGISEEAFLLVVIGNRLRFDLTEAFKQILIQIFQLDRHIELLLIGEYSEYTKFFTDDIFCDRIHYIGYHDHLNDVIGIADLYFNPPRTGGGTSALIALNAGVPVVTLPEGDVAGNVGKDFICKDEQDMIRTVQRYLMDREFYEHQKQIGMDLIRSRSDSISEEKVKLDKIRNAIIALEEGVNS